ncbi:MAG: hypothetical protein ABEJ70_07245 [Halobacteriaceae archaeon]
MIDLWFVVLIAARVALLLLGVATTFVSYRAYRRETTTYLRNATIGFGVITLGVLIEGGLFQLTSLTLGQVHVVESVTIGIGLVFLLWSFLR